MHLIQILQRIQRLSPLPGAHPLRIRNEKDRIALTAKLDPLIVGWKKPAAPAGFSSVRVAQPRQQHDESGQVSILASKPVSQPRPDARTADDLMAGVHENLR